MADYTVLSEVGETLVNAIWRAVQADNQVKALIDNVNRISLESPADLQNNDSVRISIYLYRIVEDPHAKNRFPVEGSGGALRKPPLTLDLYYLVTPLVGAPREQQIVLGKVMQVLYDEAIMEGADLSGSLAANGEQLRVILNPTALEETTRVWQALEMSYRLSVSYIVRVAMMDSQVERFLQPVVRKTSTYGQGDLSSVTTSSN